MSVEALAVVLHHADVKGTAKVILLGIANHEGDGGSWPSLSTLARYAGVTRDAARKVVAQLEAGGYIVRVRNGGGTRTTPEHMQPNLYYVLVRCPEDCDGTTNHRTKKDRHGVPSLPSFPSEDHPPREAPRPPSRSAVPRTGASEFEGSPPASSRDEPSFNHLQQVKEEALELNRAREPFDCVTFGHKRTPEGVCERCGTTLVVLKASRWAEAKA